MNIEDITIVLHHLDIASYLDKPTALCLSLSSSRIFNLVYSHITTNYTINLFCNNKNEQFERYQPNMKRIAFTRCSKKEHKQHTNLFYQQLLNLPPSITYLRISLNFTLYVDRLPYTIQSLHIYSTDWNESVDKLPRNLQELVINNVNFSQRMC